MAISEDRLLRETALNFFAHLRHTPPNPNYPRVSMAQDLFEQAVASIEAANITLAKSQRMKPPKELPNLLIAMAIAECEQVACISLAGDGAASGYDLLGVYEDSGPNEGIYNTEERALNRIIRGYNSQVTQRDIGEIRSMLYDFLPRQTRCMDRDLIPVNNGIFNYKRKVLEPFTPDLIFLSKSHVNYNPGAQNVIIHNPDDNTDWDVESWIAELSEDPEIVYLLWQILGAVIRPGVRWNKSAWLYSTSGNSGKGTLCELMRNLCGSGSYASISLADFSKDFMLEPLIRASAIIVDENDVGIYLDKVANLKAVITNDVILINRKFKEPIKYQFFGFMVQCLNEYPKVRDRSNSFYRRQLFIPFDKCFTGRERKYIKNEYLSRSDVLEYVMCKVLNMDYYKLSEPAACKAMLDDLKVANSPVCEFAEDMLPQCRWDLLPFTFLFDLYKKWFAEMNPCGSPLGYQAFLRELLAAISDNPDWMCEGKKVQVPSKNRMDLPEPLILRYDLKNWMSTVYRGSDANQLCMPKLSVSYRGLQRKVPTTAVTNVLPAVVSTGSMYSQAADTEVR